MPTTKELLAECLLALNSLPRKKYYGKLAEDTYKLASLLEKSGVRMAHEQVAGELVRIAKEMVALEVNMRNLYDAVRKVVDVEMSRDGIYSTENLDLATFNKVRKVLAKKLKWLGFDMVKKWSGGQLWRNEEMGGVEIEIYSTKMNRGWSFMIQPS